jgi:deoxycytidylate deaminase
MTCTMNMPSYAIPLSQSSLKIQKMFHKCAINAINSDMANKHSAVIVHGGKVVASGFNHKRCRNKTISPRQDICALHAEMHALLGLLSNKKLRSRRRSSTSRKKRKGKPSCFLWGFREKTL